MVCRRLKEGKSGMKVGKLSLALLGRNTELRGTKGPGWPAFRKPLSTGGEVEFFKK